MYKFDTNYKRLHCAYSRLSLFVCDLLFGVRVCIWGMYYYDCTLFLSPTRHSWDAWEFTDLTTLQLHSVWVHKAHCQVPVHVVACLLVWYVTYTIASWPPCIHRHSWKRMGWLKLSVVRRSLLATPNTLPGHSTWLPRPMRREMPGSRPSTPTYRLSLWVQIIIANS